jgi:exonuclease SbcD
LYNRNGEREGICLCVPYLRQGDYPAAEENEENSFSAGVERLYRKLILHATKQQKPGEALITMGHLYVGNAELSENDRSERVIIGGLESVHPEIFGDRSAYVALGHIHKAQRVGGKEHIRYSGSPLPMSFSETHYNHQTVSVILEKGEITEIKSIPIPVCVELLRVPQSPQPPEEVLEALRKLPDKTTEEIDHLPYLEVRVLFTEADPCFLQ